jgi:hypothetical protein
LLDLPSLLSVRAKSGIGNIKVCARSEPEQRPVIDSDSVATSTSGSDRRHRIEIKVTEAQKDLIRRAAAAQKTGLSEFVRTCAEKAARETLKGR